MKRLYHLLALLAFINLFAVAGLVGYLFSSGKLNAERMDQIATVLRGEFPKPEVATSRPAESEVRPEASHAEIARLRTKKEYYALLADRHLREMADYFRGGLTNLGYEVIKGEHPIVPLMVRDTRETKRLVDYLKERQVLVVGLKYPIVPQGDESIRFQISADHTRYDLDYVLGVLKEYKG